MKLWVDDIREAPEGWDVARTYDEAVKKLLTTSYRVVSLDHDLGEEKTGYDIACVIEAMVVKGYEVPSMIMCHSANPVGKARISQAVKSIYQRVIEGKRGN